MASTRDFRYPLWSRGDVDGFFGLMVDNLVQVLVILALCPYVAGIPMDVVTARILPGVAISLLLGNLFYGIQAHIVARRSGNAATTALPYGINTPSVFAFLLFVMGPTYQQAVAAGIDPLRAGELAWLAGVAACLVSGLVELIGAFFAEPLRRATPRAALLGVLAAVGITFIASDFAFRLFDAPLVGMVAFGVLLLAYFAKFRFPLGLPGGLVAIALGTAVAWIFTLGGVAEFGAVSTLSVAEVTKAFEQVGWITPQFYGAELLALLQQSDLIVKFLAISIPMGVINVIGSLQNIESAEAGGDRYPTAPSLAANGIGSIAAGLFGSCFPTTIYIGHPGWKGMGAKAGYSIANGLFFTVCFLFGFGQLIGAVIPIDAGAAIVVYIGIIITAQAFQTTPRHHAPAVAIALFPGLAAFLVVTLAGYLSAAGASATLGDLLVEQPPRTELLGGMLAIAGANSSWIIGTLILAALSAALLDRRYGTAAVWSGIGAVLTAIGFLHAYWVDGLNQIHGLFIWQAWPLREASAATPPGGDAVAVYATRAFPLAAGWAVLTLLFAGAAWWSGRSAQPNDAPDTSEPLV